MFVRFRQARHRLQASLVENRRVDGRVRHEHIASLGSVGTPPSVADRVEFWRQVHERFSRLGNRIDAEAQAKLLAAVHARIPMATIDEIRALQLENAEADERFWNSLHDMQTEQADGNKRLAAAAERAAAKSKAEAEKARAKAETAKDRVARIKRREVVAGGLGKQIDVERFLRARGWTTADTNHVRIVADLSRLGGFKELIDETVKRQERTDRAAARAVLRRRLSHAAPPAPDRGK
jgi:hypothetical protein